MPGMKSSGPIDKDCTAPCLERLKRLEHMVMELNQRSPRIPPEKEDLIEESMRRIRSIECDIKKTQRVSNFTTHISSLVYLVVYSAIISLHSLSFVNHTPVVEFVSIHLQPI
jgi:hypothetical protein